MTQPTTQHTPGPWKIVPGVRGYEHSIMGTDGDAACDVPETSHPTTTAEANARLIAASPDLLEVARFAVHYIESNTPGNQTTDLEAVAKIRAAIAKATTK